MMRQLGPLVDYLNGSMITMPPTSLPISRERSRTTFTHDYCSMAVKLLCSET